VRSDNNPTAIRQRLAARAVSRLLQAKLPRAARRVAARAELRLLSHRASPSAPIRPGNSGGRLSDMSGLYEQGSSHHRRAPAAPRFAKRTPPQFSNANPTKRPPCINAGQALRSHQPQHRESEFRTAQNSVLQGFWRVKSSMAIAPATQGVNHNSRVETKYRLARSKLGQ